MVTKSAKRSILGANKRKGKRAENRVMNEYKNKGWNVKKTGKGHDFKATKTTDMWTGKKTTKYVEVKTGDAKLSET